MNKLKTKNFQLQYKESIIEIEVNFENKLTMLDGKCANAVTNNPSAKMCNICGAKPVEMNKFIILQSLDSDSDALELGISPLHIILKTVVTPFN
jgi:hypothetical protein